MVNADFSYYEGRVLYHEFSKDEAHFKERFQSGQWSFPKPIYILANNHDEGQRFKREVFSNLNFKATKEDFNRVVVLTDPSRARGRQVNDAEFWLADGFGRNKCDRTRELIITLMQRGRVITTDYTSDKFRSYMECDQGANIPPYNIAGIVELSNLVTVRLDRTASNYLLKYMEVQNNNTFSLVCPKPQGLYRRTITMRAYWEDLFLFIASGKETCEAYPKFQYEDLDLGPEIDQ